MLDKTLSLDIPGVIDKVLNSAHKGSYDVVLEIVKGRNRLLELISNTSTGSELRVKLLEQLENTDGLIKELML